MKSAHFRAGEIFVILALLFLFAVVTLEQKTAEPPEQETAQTTTITPPVPATVVMTAHSTVTMSVSVTASIDAQDVDAPPIILSDVNERWRFELGSAVIPPEMRAALRDEIIPQLEKNSETYQCDTVEIVGHTDETHINAAGGGFKDSELISMFAQGKADSLKPNTNVDLGMLRAMAVVQLFREFKQETSSGGNPRLPRIKYFFPYSAGQMIWRGNLVTVDTGKENRQRRRIEIRLVRSRVSENNGTS